jgi:hypothetical protein
VNRYEIKDTGDHWVVLEKMSGLPFGGAVDRPLNMLQAQALADFRNGLETPVQKQVRSRLNFIRIAWRSIMGPGR